MSEYRKMADSLIIVDMETPEEIDIIPSKKGAAEPVFFEGIFSFYPTAAVGLGYYPETHEQGSEFFCIDRVAGNRTEPNFIWMEFFMDELDRQISANGEYTIPMVRYFDKEKPWE